MTKQDYKLAANALSKLPESAPAKPALLMFLTAFFTEGTNGATLGGEEFNETEFRNQSLYKGE